MVGATCIDAGPVVEALPHSFILSPGIGAQGATLDDCRARLAPALGRILPNVSRELIGKLRKAYRHLIHHNTSRAISLIEGDPSLAAPEVQYLVDFIRTAAKRGVILRRPSKKTDGDEE